MTTPSQHHHNDNDRLTSGHGKARRTNVKPVSSHHSPLLPPPPKKQRTSDETPPAERWVGSIGINGFVIDDLQINLHPTPSIRQDLKLYRSKQEAMSSRKVVLNESTKKAVEGLRKEIFGEMPILHKKTGTQSLKRVYTGTYLSRYYREDINSSVRKVSTGDCRAEPCIAV